MFIIFCAVCSEDSVSSLNFVRRVLAKFLDEDNDLHIPNHFLLTVLHNIPIILDITCIYCVYPTTVFKVI